MKAEIALTKTNLKKEVMTRIAYFLLGCLVAFMAAAGLLCRMSLQRASKGTFKNLLDVHFISEDPNTLEKLNGVIEKPQWRDV